MLNREIITDRIDQIRTSTNRLYRLAQLEKSDFLAEADNFAIAEHHLRRSLEAVLDIGRHLIAKKGLGKPVDYKDIIIIMGKNSILSKELADKIKGNRVSAANLNQGLTALFPLTDLIQLNSNEQ